MNAREFAKLLTRDLHCLHCGVEDETLVVQHRINRGMGGAGVSSKRNKPSNWVVLCSGFNGLIESDPDAAQEARARGYKLESWQDPLTQPVWDSLRRKWLLLDDAYGSFEAYDWDELS